MDISSHLFQNDQAKPVEAILSEARLDGDGSLTQQVYRLIRELIVELHLLPNQFLSEKDVAAILNISRTPVREAFIRLSEDGLLNIVPKSGNYVSPIDINRAFEGYLFRSSMESACVALLAERNRPEDVKTLKRELARQRKCVEQNDDSGFLLLDRRFHEMLFVAANLPTIKRMINAAKFEVDRIKNLRNLYRLRPKSLSALLGEHKEMVDAIAAGDCEKAKSAVAKHFSGISDSLDAIGKEAKFWGMFHGAHLTFVKLVFIVMSYDFPDKVVMVLYSEDSHEKEVVEIQLCSVHRLACA